MEIGAASNLRAQVELARTTPEDETSRRIAREFEAVFLSQAVEEMLKNVDIGSFGGGHAEETWRSFLARAYAEELAAQGTTGIAQGVESTIAAYTKGTRG